MIPRERDDSPLDSSEGQEEGEKKLVCWFCHQPGNLYQGVNCGNRLVHKNRMYENHILFFTKNLENDGNKQVVCWGCDQPVLGDAYKCSKSKSECKSNCSSFVIQDSCTKLSYQINHPLHPDHILSLREPGPCHCLACCTPHDRAFFYNCDSCDFQLGIKCTNTFPPNPNNCHQHKFSSILGQIQSICNACGKEIKNIACLCIICKILVHNRCANIPRTTKIRLHNHPLNLTYYPREIKKPNNMVCRFDAYKVNTEYTAYYCHECSYILHTECLTLSRDRFGESLATSESVPNKSIGYATHLIKALNQVEDEGPHPREIQHFNYQQYKLILCDDEVKDDKLCEECMELIILAPFYSCAQHDFFLHTRCAKLPTWIEQHRLHEFHPLTLLPKAYTKSDKFMCTICYRHHPGFPYGCDICKSIHICVQCGLIPETLKHEGHQNSLFLTLDYKEDRKCNACSMASVFYAFVCTNCNFILGVECANLLLVARNKYDTHLLKFTYTAENDFGKYYCLICEKKRDPNHWFYYCTVSRSP